MASDEVIKLGLSYGKVIDTILGNLDGVILGIDDETNLVYLDESFDDYNESKVEGLFREGSFLSTGGKVLGSDEGIKLGLFDGKVLRTILWNVYAIIFVIDFGTNMGFIDGSSDQSNDVKLDVLIFGG